MCVCARARVGRAERQGRQHMVAAPRGRRGQRWKQELGRAECKTASGRGGVVLDRSNHGGWGVLRPRGGQWMGKHAARACARRRGRTSDLVVNSHTL